MKSSATTNQKTSIFILFLATLSVVFTSTSSSLYLNNAHAETGIGRDVFKVIVSIFGVTRDSGDIVATVTVNGNSKVKSFDVDNLNLGPSVDNSTQGGEIIEYVTTFPDLEVKSGDEYKVCVLTIESTDRICQEGTNSVAKRPEIVDFSLDKLAEDTDSEEEVDED
jgi:hypothetical protein